MKFEDPKVKHNVVTQGPVEHCIKDVGQAGPIFHRDEVVAIFREFFQRYAMPSCRVEYLLFGL